MIMIHEKTLRVRYPWGVFATQFGSLARNRPKLGRFRKDSVLGQSKGIGGLARPWRSWIGYWFGRPSRRGGEIDENRVLNFGGPIKIGQFPSSCIHLSSFRFPSCSTASFITLLVTLAVLCIVVRRLSRCISLSKETRTVKRRKHERFVDCGTD